MHTFLLAKTLLGVDLNLKLLSLFSKLRHLLKTSVCESLSSQIAKSSHGLKLHPAMRQGKQRDNFIAVAFKKA